jgi:hypothetical protein
MTASYPDPDLVTWTKKIAKALEDEDPSPLRGLLDDIQEDFAPGFVTMFDELLDNEPALCLESRHSDLQRSLKCALGRAQPRPGLTALIVSYVYLMALDGWERTASWSNLDGVLSLLMDKYEGATPDAVQKIHRKERLIVEGLVDRARRMSSMIWVESAMNSSSAAAMKKHALDVVGQAISARDCCDSKRAELSGSPYMVIWEELARSAAADRTYYGALAEFASAIETVNAWDRDKWLKEELGLKLESAIRTVRAATRAEPVAESPVSVSELKAHLRVLEQLVEVQTQPFLLAHKTTFTYCYPIVLEIEDLDWDALASRARAIKAEEFSPFFVRAQPLHVTDMWPLKDAATRGAYAGIELVLSCPRIEPRDAGTADVIEVDEATIRLTELGNHHLRITVKQCISTLHDIHQGLRRGSTEMGYERVVVADGEDNHAEGAAAAKRQDYRNGWHRLAGFASDVVERLGLVLVGAPSVQSPPAMTRISAKVPARSPSRVMPDRAGPARPARVLPAHTVLSIESLCIIGHDGEERPASAADLVTARPVTGQALLCQPIRQFASSLEEWLRFCPRPPAGLNLLEGHGFIGEVAAGTMSSTVFPIVQMPKFLLLEYEELAEFVASLDAIFVAHKDKLARLKKRLDEIMRDLKTPAHPLKREEVENYKLRIEEVRQQASDAILARSSELLRTAAHREFMERLPLVAELKDKEDEVRLEAARVSASYEWIVSYMQWLDRRARARVQFGLSLALGVLAVMSLFELFGFIDLDVNRKPHPSVVYLSVELIAAGMLVGLVLLLTWRLGRNKPSEAHYS